jgi:hypothetical protein
VVRLEPGVQGPLASASFLAGNVDPHAAVALFSSTLLTWVYEGYFGALRISTDEARTVARYSAGNWSYALSFYTERRYR